MRIIFFVTLLFTLCWLSNAKGATEEVKKKEYEIEVITDVPYVKDGSQAQKLDIIRPKEKLEKPMPVIVWIHGGGWIAGDKGPDGRFVVPYAKKGYFGVSINYRFSNEAIFPAQIEDCKCAIRFLRAHAKEYNIDPDRIGVWGASAGGHLSALLGTAGDVKELEGKGGWQEFSSRVQAVCDWFGPTDITKMKHLNEAKNLVGGDIEKNHDLAVKASPITYVTKDDPPFMILQGAKDNLVPLEQSTLLEKKLKEAGVPVELIIFEGAGHGGPDFEKKETKDRIMKFFDKHLKFE